MAPRTSGIPEPQNASENEDAVVVTQRVQANNPEKNLEAGVLAADEPQRSDQNVVDWNGPDDPEHPINWSRSKKWVNILTVASLTFLTPFASSMIAPAIDEIMNDLNTTSRDIGSFVVSIYLLGYAFGPLFLAPCSELYGRLWTYHICTGIFIVTNVACALSINMPMLIIFRFLTGLMGACPLTIGPGTVSDLFRQEERGLAMSIWVSPALVGPTIGPAFGAYASRALGWRWTFWILVILTTTFFVFCLIVQRETYPPTLLDKKCKKLAKSSGNPRLRPARKPTQSQWQLFSKSIVRPLKLLFLSPVVFGLSLLNAVAYGILYILFTMVGEVFGKQYGIVNNVGLIYLGPGIGQMAALAIFGTISDAMVKRMAKGGEMKPEYRLPPMVPGGAMLPIGLLIFGWSAQYEVFWFVPIIGTFFIGMGIMTIWTPCATYLVDSFPLYAASATAANTVLRSVGGALLPIAGPRMYENLGLGWGNTVLAGLSLLLMGMIILALKYGERLRTSKRFQLAL